MQTAYPRSRVRGRGAVHEVPYVAPVLHSRDVKGTFSSVGLANEMVTELFNAEMGGNAFEQGEEKDTRMWWYVISLFILLELELECFVGIGLMMGQGDEA